MENLKSEYIMRQMGYMRKAAYEGERLENPGKFRSCHSTWLIPFRENYINSIGGLSSGQNGEFLPLEGTE